MGTVSQASRNMKAFVIVALVAAVAGEADPYPIGQVLAGQTNGGVLTSTTYHGGVKVAGFPYTKAVLPAVTYAGWPYAHAGVLYGKREAEAEPYYYGYGLGYHGLGYRLGYGYGHGLYYGKREAEAEPKAEAEPYYYGYGLGYHGLGYR